MDVSFCESLTFAHSLFIKKKGNKGAKWWGSTTDFNFASHCNTNSVSPNLLMTVVNGDKDSSAKF